MRLGVPAARLINATARHGHLTAAALPVALSEAVAAGTLGSLIVLPGCYLWIISLALLATIGLHQTFVRKYPPGEHPHDADFVLDSVDEPAQERALEQQRNRNI